MTILIAAISQVRKNPSKMLQRAFKSIESKSKCGGNCNKKPKTTTEIAQSKFQGQEQRVSIMSFCGVVDFYI